MRSIRLAVLVAPTLLAALLLVPPALAQTPVSFTGPTNIRTGDGPVSVAAGDFNADQDPDLVVASIITGNVSVLLGGAGGGFGAPTDFPAGETPFAVAVGEFNGDNDPDLAVANQSPIASGVSVLLGGAGGSFGAPTTYPAGAGPLRSRWPTSTATRTPTSRSPTRTRALSRCGSAAPAAPLAL